MWAPDLSCRAPIDGALAPLHHLALTRDRDRAAVTQMCWPAAPLLVRAGGDLNALAISECSAPPDLHALRSQADAGALSRRGEKEGFFLKVFVADSI